MEFGRDTNVVEPAKPSVQAAPQRSKQLRTAVTEVFDEMVVEELFVLLTHFVDQIGAWQGERDLLGRKLFQPSDHVGDELVRRIAQGIIP